jgi:type VI protein secretion system component VasF
MRENDQDRFFYEWQRHEAEQLARLDNPSREDAIRTAQERREARADAWGNTFIGAVFGVALAVVLVSYLS